ncbi:MAG: DUF4499 domain-containing protein [Polyangiaceae bacterium]
MTRSDSVERPHLLWWVAIVGGLTLLAVQGFSAPFYSWWIEHVHGLPAQPVLAWIFLGCIPLHIGEAIFCYRLSNRLGTPQASLGWALQTFIIGFPSTLLLIKRSRLHESVIGGAAASR